MITSLSELLEALRTKEAAVLKRHDIKHGPTIGDMYEGLTRDIVGRAIPNELGVQVVEGFIEGLAGEKSNQADVLLVKGEGRKIPYTDKVVWPIRDVLAVFEVKKTLYGDSLADAFTKMMKVAQLHKAFEASGGYSGKSIAFAHKNFARATGFYPKFSDVSGLPEPLQMIHHITLMEHLAPVRIILGYEGYVDELSLRKGISSYLLGQGPGPDRGMMSLPSLVVCRNNSVLKLNGMPYCDRQDDVEGWWNTMASNAENPTRLMLEMLWTKIGTELDILLPMDDSLNQEKLAPFLRQKYFDGEIDGRRQTGFMMDFIEHLPSVDVEPEDSTWTPHDTNVVESVALMRAAQDGTLRCDDLDFVEFAAKHGTTTSSILESLTQKRVMGWMNAEKTIARPIEESFVTVFTPSGKTVVSDQSGMLSLWAEQQLFTRKPRRSKD
ncbi:DUF6602 domain-containing protein [Variovorax sp. M-6]|uniref:DUF6602 domain-containing protein n=1 Tax=Variovorax sp. M-6 TaxID=3233041 RepID=UPI003F9BF4AB